MVKNTAFLFLMFCSVISFSQIDSLGYSECEVKKNGIYYAELDKETNIYIRFHDGDTVVTTSSENDLDKAAIYINKNLGQGMLYGKYFTSDRSCSLRIKAKNEYGRVKMDGFISDDKIMMSVVNIDENTARDFIFNFHPISKK